MAMSFSILGTGSSGNSALLRTENTRILIDAGFSARRLGLLLEQQGECLEHIEAIFITHEHGDHASGIEGLKKYPHIKIFANPATAKAIQAGLKHHPSWQFFETGQSFKFKDLDVETFSIPHDAQDPVGFRFSSGLVDDLISPQRALAWVTDLGYVPQNVRERIRDCDFVVVESNHSSEMLKADTKRPWPTKQRISGRHGHLSNDAVREMLDTVASPRWRQIFLTHLSRDCNSISEIETCLAPLRTRLSCRFNIVPPGESTPLSEVG
jgi:phosphoribosyl 1,2-cyclic phosphodiesterase